MVAASWYLPLEAPEDRLYARCMFCNGAFPHSVLFSRVPPGNRLAFDTGRGRLWSICGRCSRWNLIPGEERFDAIDELERVVHDGALLLAGTANISLHAHGDLTIIRIGGARLLERAAWRYGRESSPGDVYRRIGRGRAERTADALLRAGERLGTLRPALDWGPSAVLDLVRWQRFGNVAWSGRERCAHCGSVLHTLHFDSSWWLLPRLEDGLLVVGVPCTRCDPWTPRNVFDVRGPDADALLRRSLAYQHVARASEHEVRDATSVLQRAGSAERLLAELSNGRTSLWKLGPTRTLALEIAASHLAERRAMELRLQVLEAEWRVEEPLARIVDEELS
jgi:hypothetical protein